jgi:hypothetical protein
MTMGAQAASALTTPTGSPHWNIGKPQSIRSAGSDTTFFLMQRLSDLYMQAGLYGCQLNGAAVPNNSSCLAPPNDVIQTTDTVDNYDRIEVMTGVGHIGSGAGQAQLCGTESAPLPTDFARSSKPPGTACTDMVGLGFAKDGVPLVEFSGAEGPGTATGATSPWAGAVVGPVAAGWIPGDAVTCDTAAGGTSTNTRNTINGCSGVPFNDISNNDNGGGANSTAFRLYCATGGTRITDWGQLTNLTGSTAVGSGTPINIPIQIAAVNSASGTVSTFNKFVDSGTGLCGTDTNINKSSLVCAGAQALENNAAQFGDCAALDFTASDTTRSADQAAEMSTMLYYMSLGVYGSNTHARTVVLSDGTKVAAIIGVAGSPSGGTENTIVPSKAPGGSILVNTYPTARTLYNIYRTGSVRASTAGFLDWICDSNNLYTKLIDLNTGLNYNSEITNSVQTTFGFIRLNSLTVSPNNSCQVITVAPSVSDGVTTNGSTTITSAAGFAQSGQTPVHVGDTVNGAGIPTGDHVASIANANTVVLVTAATASATAVTFTFTINSPSS